MAFDDRAEKVEKARSTFGISERLSFDVRCSGDALPFAENQVGLVIAADAGPCSITHSDVKEVARVLRPDGVFVVGAVEGGEESALETEELESLLRRWFAQVSVWGQFSATVSVMADADSRSSNGDVYRGYTWHRAGAGRDIGPGIVALPAACPTVYVCTNVPSRDPLGPSVFVPEPFFAVEPASRVPGSTETQAADGTRADGVLLSALAAMLSRLTGSEIRSDSDDLIRGMRRLVQSVAAAEDRLKAAEIMLGAAKRAEAIIRAETDTAIAQKLAQQRRVKRLRLIAVEAGEELQKISALREVSEERAEHETLAAFHFATGMMQALAAPAEARLRFSLWQRSLGRLRRRGRKGGATFFVAQGDDANRNRDWPRAASFYAAALLRDGALGPIWVQFGHALKEQGMLEEAGFAYREAARVDPANIDALIHLGHLMKRCGRDGAAMRAFQKVLQRDPAHADASLALAALAARNTAIDFGNLADRLRGEAEALE
jgi:tetratricopeptide (TPR) repeat protein